MNMRNIRIVVVSLGVMLLLSSCTSDKIRDLNKFEDIINNSTCFESLSFSSVLNVEDSFGIGYWRVNNENAYRKEVSIRRWDNLSYGLIEEFDYKRLESRKRIYRLNQVFSDEYQSIEESNLHLVKELSWVDTPNRFVIRIKSVKKINSVEEKTLDGLKWQVYKGTFDLSKEEQRVYFELVKGCFEIWINIDTKTWIELYKDEVRLFVREGRIEGIEKKPIDLNKSPQDFKEEMLKLYNNSLIALLLSSLYKS